MNPEVVYLTYKFGELLDRLNKLDQPDRILVWKLLNIADGKHVVLGENTGTMFGTQTTQKIGFLGKTPVPRQNSISNANSQGGTYNQSDVQTIATAVNSVISTLRTYGFIA